MRHTVLNPSCNNAYYKFGVSFILFFFFFLRGMASYLACNSNQPTSASLVLGLKTCATPS